MRSPLFGEDLQEAAARLTLENSKLLKARLDGDELLARQGSMVAYQGEVDFAYVGAGGVGRFLKKVFTGEGLPLMRCTGRGEVYLAREARELHLVDLDDDVLVVNGQNVLAFETSLVWDIAVVEGVGTLAIDVFSTTLTGTGRVVLSTQGRPLVLDAEAAPTFVDLHAVVAWSGSLATSLRRTAKAGALIGRGSGEAYQLGFTGRGVVVVQPSEAPPPAAGGGSR